MNVIAEVTVAHWGKSICPCRCNIVHLSVRHTHRMYGIIKVEKCSVLSMQGCAHLPHSECPLFSLGSPVVYVLLSRCFCFSLLVSSIFSPWVSSSVSAGFCTSYFSKSWQDMKNIKRCFWIWCWPFWESIKWLKNRALISPFWFAHLQKPHRTLLKLIPLYFSCTYTPNEIKKNIHPRAYFMVSPTCLKGVSENFVASSLVENIWDS